MIETPQISPQNEENLYLTIAYLQCSMGDLLTQDARATQESVKECFRQLRELTDLQENNRREALRRTWTLPDAAVYGVLGGAVVASGVFFNPTALLASLPSAAGLALSYEDWVRSEKMNQLVTQDKEIALNRSLLIGDVTEEVNNLSKKQQIAATQASQLRELIDNSYKN